MVYLYPDLMSGIIGNFHPQRHTLIKGKDVNVNVKILPRQENEYILSLRLESINEDTVGEDVETCDNYLNVPQITEIVIEVKHEFWHNQKNVFPFDAPNSKCIRLQFLLFTYIYFKNNKC